MKTAKLFSAMLLLAGALLIACSSSFQGQVADGGTQPAPTSKHCPGKSCPNKPKPKKNNVQLPVPLWTDCGCQMTGCDCCAATPGC